MSNPQPSLPLYARLAATAFGTVFLASGINANIYLSSERLNGRLFFKEDYRLIETFVEFYAFAEVCMAAAIYVAVYSGDRRVLGSLLVAGGALAFMDGTAFNVAPFQLWVKVQQTLAGALIEMEANYPWAYALVMMGFGWWAWWA